MGAASVLLGVVLDWGLLVGGQVGAAPPPPAAAPVAAKPIGSLVIVDDRDTKDQAPAAFIDAALKELGRRKGLVVRRFSAVRSGLSAEEDLALSSCGDDAGCLAGAGRALGAKVVVILRLTQREGEEARFLAITRINALRPQITDDAGGIAGSEKDALALVRQQIGEVFAEVELAPAVPAPAPAATPAPAAPAPPRR